jgi:ribosomal protein S18 acetylase RimI-like enzyme/truncated hemoglobin YjbI
MSNESCSLYDRLGGVYNIAAVVDDFVDRIMANPTLNANPSVDEAHHRVSQAGFKYLVTEMVCWAAGGPQNYTGRAMRASHEHLGITESEWQVFLADFHASLDKFGVRPTEQAELLAIVASTKADIVLDMETPALQPIAEGSINIRAFREADRASVVALWKQVFDYQAPHNDPDRIIDHKLALQRELFHVALFDGEVVGTVMGGYDGHRGWIYSLAVHPDLRGRGIGSALMRHVERQLQNAGCPKINLQLVASNSAIVDFYAKLGFLVEDRISMGKLIGGDTSA